MSYDLTPPGWYKYISERWHLTQYGSQLEDGAQFEPIEGNSKAGLKLDAVMADYRINAALRKLEDVPASPSSRLIPGSEEESDHIYFQEWYRDMSSTPESIEYPGQSLLKTPPPKRCLSPKAHHSPMSKARHADSDPVLTATVQPKSLKTDAKKISGRIRKKPCRRKHQMLTRAAARQRAGQIQQLFELDRPPSIAELHGFGT
ncbi:hypothetical protein HRR83_000842 [Exophiala dermatitidis]|uniref:Uncharacterized protein n=1 Tax=Exophiala dermatitidis TaxID=5970 RepID=A0AAN6F4B9_EXODE|nr:hypothetical protein HRR74_000846 [Exophiala dermatitidis]KAJ4528724.1 hypothetical protein HRR73_001347 [Exophiala dermatitidis]KAJ4530109.1 hypothetical protein HRR76_009343 [Exophiala dermatitidis]KAJ4558872.1 hypothetical protein HRR77_000845 [Exophiala dermatitidis]KAJ4581103.1 hypothetical protein HRR79_000153 [Exophiala dermatitidis]